MSSNKPFMEIKFNGKMYMLIQKNTSKWKGKGAKYRWG